MDISADLELRKSRRVLVVDDDEGLRRLITRTLTRNGFEAFDVGTGEDAIRETVANPELFLLLDQKLYNMTGSDVVIALNSKQVKPHFLMMTGQGDERLAVEMMKLGAVDYLVKDTDFLDRISSVLDRIFRSFQTEFQLRNAQEEQKRLRDQLTQSQKMDAIGQLAGGVAHDFNNMLGGIIGAAELIRIDENLSVEDKNSFLDLIIKTAQRGADLASKLLTFSRKGSKKRESINCVEIVKQTAAILDRTIDKAITIHIDNSSTSSTIIGDDALLQNVFLNLGINASHAMTNGGVLTFSFLETYLDETYCAHSSFPLTSGQFLEVSVQDTGSGMTPEVQRRIFEPFFTTKEQGKGTGLGLAAVYGAIQDHNGAITVYSEVGTGTVFRLYFPLVNGETEQSVALSSNPVHGKGTILVVDDEEIIRLTAKGMLESLGYVVTTASNGSEGLDTFINTEKGFDLVVLDMIMPVMGGYDTFFKIRAIRPSQKIIVSSGFSKETAITDMQKHGLDGFIRKPFNRYELSLAIADVLGSSS